MGTKVKVRYTSKVLYDGDEELHGAFYADTMTVFVSNKSAVHETLCHEIFHSFLAISGYNQGMSAATEEGLTRAFEHAFSKYLKF
jgi:hypothetical protein